MTIKKRIPTVIDKKAIENLANENAKLKTSYQNTRFRYLN
jgi:hypothetical protein